MPDQDELHGIVERMVRAGENEDDIANVIRHYTPPQTATAHPEGVKPSMDIGGPRMLLDAVKRIGSDVYGAATAHPATTGALIGGTAAAPFTGGMSLLPAAGLMGLASAGGAGYGLAAKGLATGESASATENAKTMATEGALGSLGEIGARGVAAGARKLAPILREGAVSAYESMLKPRETTLRGMTRFGDTLPEQLHGVASELLDEGVNITKRGARKVRGKIDTLANKATSIMDEATNLGKRGPTSMISEELGNARKFAGRQLAPDADVAAVDRVSRSIEGNPQITKRVRGRTIQDTGIVDASGKPITREVTVDTGKRAMMPTVTVQRLDDLKRGTYRSLGNKAYGELGSAEAEAQKAAARGARRSIESVVPEIGPVHAEESRLIDLADVIDQAAFRSGKNHRVGLQDSIVLNGKHLALIPAALMNHPMIGSPLARGANALSRGLGGAVPHGNIARSILLALMGQEADQQK
jgi:hypothetical protein